MKHSLGTFAVTAGLVAGLSSVALAGVTPEKFSIGPYLGGYAFDRSQDYKGSAFTAGGKLGFDINKRFGIDLGIGTILADTKDPNSQDARIAKYGFDLLYHLLPDNRLVPYLAAGFGGLNLGTESGGKPTSRGAFDYGFGARYYLNDDIALRADVRHIIFSTGQVRNNFEYTAGISFFFDGRCCEDAKPVVVAPPTTPAPVPEPPKPAPAPVVLAPTATIAAVPPAILSGQNATLNWSSQNATNCTIDQGIGTVQPQGSMSVAPTAGTTYNLNCQGAGGSATSATAVAVTAPPPPAAPTCAIDAVPASVEKGTASTLTWSSQNASACDLQPGVGPVQPQGTIAVTPATDTTYNLNCQGAGGVATSTTAVAVTIPPPPAPEKPCQSITLDVKFDTSKADIKGAYEAELQRFADVLKENPKATTVIEGHTDNVGDADMNLKLSQRRSDSVRTFLINKLGIAAERLTAKGYGLTKPIASNKSTAGKAKNRRIEAHIFCGK